jgi:hypothetical protein
MNIQPIVEGYGEVPAVPVLLRRLRDEAGVFQLDVNRPIRRYHSELVAEASLRKAVRLARLQADCCAVLILFDSDTDCPKTLAPTIQAWAQSEARDIPCAVVMAHREYEAWFLATVESLRGRRSIRHDAISHPQPEAPRGAKEELERRMAPGKNYSETRDQAPLTAAFDLATAHARCRSFRRLVRAFGLLVVGAGIPLANWPPAGW